jgi:colanic acid biosynthesis glycosyl transferase WcaI
MHVVLLNQAFHPDVVATAQMGKDLADALVRRGHRVSVVASRSIYGKSGAVLPKRETIPVAAITPHDKPGAIQAYRVGFSMFGKSSIAARIADFALFYLLATLRVLTLPRADVIICYTTPPFIALVGILCRWFRGSKAVYWVMDLYPDLPVACGVMKPAALPTRLFERLNRYLLRASDVCVVLGRCMQDRVLAKGTPAARVVRIPVWADLSGLEPVPHPGNDYRARWAPRNEFLVMYSGNLGLGHDARTMIDAMILLKNEPDIRFVFIGGGKRRKEVADAVASNALTNVVMEEYQPREAIARSLSAGDLHLISLKEGVEGIMVPSKLFGIMAVARASVFVGHPSSEISRVLTESSAGLTIREGDAQGLADAIRTLRDDRARAAQMGQNARAELMGKYDAQTACNQWITLLEAQSHTQSPSNA